MKKLMAAILSLIMILSLGTTAFAAETEPAAQSNNGDFCIEGVEVIVTYEEDTEAMMNLETDDGGTPLARAYTVQDLGTSGSVSLDWTVNSESNVRSQYNYKTNSEEMTVKMKAGEQTTSVTLKCFNTNGTEVFAKTVNVNTLLNAKFEITGLSYSHTYYFRLYNNDQHMETFTGTISA